MTEDAEVICVAFGISSRICKEAVRLARARGVRLGLIRPITLWPFPVKAFRQLGAGVKSLLCVEMNILGQMVEDVKAAVEYRLPVESFRTFFDVPDSEDIAARAAAIISAGEGRK